MKETVRFIESAKVVSAAYCVPEEPPHRYNISVFASDISGTGVPRRSRAPGTQSIIY
jgi:hypothetical protein